MTKITIKDTYVNKSTNACPPSYAHMKGCVNPIAIMQVNYRWWNFITSSEKLTGEVIYGYTPEEMVERLKKYLALPSHSYPIEFVRIIKGRNGPCSIQVFQHPTIELKCVEDILKHLNYVDKYKKVKFILTSLTPWDFDSRAQLLLESWGYVIDDGMVRKNKRLAIRRKKRREIINKTFKVSDICNTIKAIRKTNIIGNRVMLSYKTRSSISHMNVLLILLSVIENVYGKNSYRRIIPFQKMIKKWKDSKAFTSTFHTKEFKCYKEWLDKEASKRKSRSAPIIKSTNIIDHIINK